MDRRGADAERVELASGGARYRELAAWPLVSLRVTNPDEAWLDRLTQREGWWPGAYVAGIV